MFDLLSTVEYGGCSAKLDPEALDALLSQLKPTFSKELIVSSDTHDDAAVYRLNDSTGLIFTTDFFPPVCSDPYEFGQIAAANSLSDVYAMGGQALMALNIIMFPSQKIDPQVLLEILKGGQDKVAEAGCMTVGGHTIDDYPPKYGLAVLGTVHPDRVISNAQACPGDYLILTKAIGTGTIIAGQRVGLCSKEHYRAAIESMKQLNKSGAELMQKYNVHAATDITGFSLPGHALKMCKASKVSMTIDSSKVALLEGAYELTDQGCIPGAVFRNRKYIDNDINYQLSDNNLKMLLADPQTSGGLLICVKPEQANALLADLRLAGYLRSEIIGYVSEMQNRYLEIV